MKEFTFKVTCFVDVMANDEETATEIAEEMFPVDPYCVELYEVGDGEPDWDAIADDRRLSE